MEELKKEDYKLIEISDIKEEEYKSIKELNERFPKTDIFFEIEDNKLLVYLRVIDYKKFKKELKSIIKKENLHSDNVIENIIKEIENIKSYGLKTGRRLYVGYNKERKVKDRKNKEKERGVYYYALDHNFSKQNNELPQEFINKIICADSEHFLKNLPDNCVDLIFTSPPYNFGLEYENHKDGTNWNEYFNKLFCVFKECIRVLKYGGRIIVNVQPLFSDYIPIHHIVSDFFMKNKMIWKGEILWDKHNYNAKYTAWGSWKSPSNPYLKYTWEFLEIFCKGDLKKEGKREDIDITDEEFKKFVMAKWDIAPERNMKEFGHPAMFPENLVNAVLKLFSYKNDIILDPFNGVGTTCVVAKRLGRNFIGIDVSDEYCKATEKRLKETEQPLNKFTENN